MAFARLFRDAGRAPLRAGMRRASRPQATRATTPTGSAMMNATCTYVLAKTVSWMTSVGPFPSAMTGATHTSATEISECRCLVYQFAPSVRTPTGGGLGPCICIRVLMAGVRLMMTAELILTIHVVAPVSSPASPPTPGVPCEDDCHCNDYDLSELAKDMKDGMTHHACDKDKYWCYMFSLCGPIPADELPRGCHTWQADGIAALRYRSSKLCPHVRARPHRDPT